MLRFERILILAAGLLSSLAAFAAPPKSSPANSNSAEEALALDLPVIHSASLHEESLRDAPSAVTVITAADIYRYGYRTLAEAISATVPGLYISYDRTYHYGGLRGFNLPGDYSTRWLLMVNGHRLSDNVYDLANFLGRELGVDLELVKRIEIIRGPGSALHGSNAMLCTINVVTKTPLEVERASASVDIGSAGEKRVFMSTSSALGKHGSLLFGGSAYYQTGPSIYVQQYDSPEFNNGILPASDRESAGHAFSIVQWKNWDVTALLSTRNKQMPIEWMTTAFDGADSRVTDDRNFVSAAYNRELGPGKLNFELSYDWYLYTAKLNQTTDIELQNRDISRGHWLGARATYRFDTRIGALTFGGESYGDLQATQQNFDILPERQTYVDVRARRTIGGAFLQTETALSKHWRLVLGARLDLSSVGQSVVSPRLGAIYQPSKRTALKVLYGRGFRNASAYERFYDLDRYQQRNQSLRPESSDNIEIIAEQNITTRLSLSASAYRYWVRDLVQLVTLDGGLIQYRNSADINAHGVELAADWKARSGITALGSVALQRARNAAGTLPNSPAVLAKLRLGVPVPSTRLSAAASYVHMSDRLTLARASVPRNHLWDMTLTSKQLHPLFDVVVGVRNAAGNAYPEPSGLSLDQVPSRGRTWFARLVWTTRE